MCLQNVLSIAAFVAALCTSLAFLKAWFSVWKPGYLLYAWLPKLVSLRVQHGFQVFQFGVTSLELWAKETQKPWQKCFQPITNSKFAAFRPSA